MAADFMIAIEAEPAPAKYPVGGDERAIIERAFVYPTPRADQAPRCEYLLSIAKGFAYLLTMYCPPSRERSLALTKLEECVMWANAAIARNEAQP